MKTNFSSELRPPSRLLLGPGPSNIHPRVSMALGLPIVSHLDPFFLEVMDDVKELLKSVFKTRNRFSIALSGGGTVGMEAALANLIEDDCEVVVCQNGYFGGRMAEIVARLGGQPKVVRETWGNVISEEAVEEALKNSNAKVVTVVQGETSTGILQPLEGISKIAKSYDAFLIVDTVSSLGGSRLNVDQLGIDVCYSGTQKCLNSPPGLSPITVSDKVVDYVYNRQSKVKSFYFDFSLLDRYWGDERAYHHTATIPLVYALKEALSVVIAEGLENIWARHTKNSDALTAGVEALGLKIFVPRQHRLSSLNVIKIPEKVNDSRLRINLLNDHGIEIGSGLGELKNKVWRVGLMGINSCESVVLTFLSAFEMCLLKEGYPVSPGSGVSAAQEYYLSNN